MKKIQNTSFSKIAIIMNDRDNVAIAKKNIEKDTLIIYKDKEIKISDPIPQGHRFSLVDIPKGTLLFQYGYPFGISQGIITGKLINKHNVEIYRIDYENLRDYMSSKLSTEAFENNLYDQIFMGYKRDNGKVGTRNYYLIMPTSLCASDVGVKLSYFFRNKIKPFANIDGIVAAAHTEGCGCNSGEIIDRLMLTMRNTILHPNVGGVLIIDLGCEKTNYKYVSDYLGNMSFCGKPIDFLSIQKSGGTGKSIEAGKHIIYNRLNEVNACKREKFPLKHLIIGTECGASDSFSGITANPVIGKTVDKIIYSGGSAILSETPEMMGAEVALVKRMKSEEVLCKFINGVNYYRNLANKLNTSIDGNFVPGNEKGGLVNLTLKSLGAILKGGNTEIVDFIDYGESVKHDGLSIMNGPGNDLESMTGLVASGANLILFSTGMGTTEGNIIVPVIKLSTRTEVYNNMKEDIDFNAGLLLEKNKTIDELSDNLLNMVIKVASGKKTWAEKWEKRAFQIWTAGKLSL